MSEPTKSDRTKWLRLGALVLLFVVSLVLVETTGLADTLSRDQIRAWMDDAGVWGLLLFLGIFAVGELLHVPGLVFVGAAILAYGRLYGGLAGYLGAVVSVSVSFFVVRLVGGQPLAEVKRPFLKRWLDRLDAAPIRSVAVLRLLLWMAPPLNYALAMSSVRFRDYLLGSILGLVIPITLVSMLFDWILENLLT